MRMFDMLTNVDIKRIKAQGDLGKRVTELENSLSIALEINDNYQRENKKLKDNVRVAEGETSIVKAVGINSPEMREAQTRIKELEDKCREAGRAMIELNVKYEAALADVARAKEEHQYDKMVHEKELKDLTKK